MCSALVVVMVLGGDGVERKANMETSQHAVPFVVVGSLLSGKDGLYRSLLPATYGNHVCFLLLICSSSSLIF